MKKLSFTLVSLGLIFLGAGCYSSAPSAVPSSQPVTPQAAAPAPAPTPSGSTSVSISGFSFQPVSLTVKAGTLVIWTNQDPTNHTITSDDGTFNSGPIAQNATYSHTFDKAGTYSYHCSIHPSMQATVTVQ